MFFLVEQQPGGFSHYNENKVFVTQLTMREANAFFWSHYQDSHSLQDFINRVTMSNEDCYSVSFPFPLSSDIKNFVRRNPKADVSIVTSQSFKTSYRFLRDSAYSDIFWAKSASALNDYLTTVCIKGEVAPSHNGSAPPYRLPRMYNFLTRRISIREIIWLKRDERSVHIEHGAKGIVSAEYGTKTQFYCHGSGEYFDQEDVSGEFFVDGNIKPRKAVTGDTQGNQYLISNDYFYEHYRTCHACNEVVIQDECYYQDDENYCRGCFDDRFSSCGFCEEHYPYDDLSEDDDGESVCQGCRDRGRGNWESEYESENDEDDETNDDSEPLPNDSRIVGYNTRVDTKIIKPTKKIPYQESKHATFGIEMEFNFTRNQQNEVITQSLRTDENKFPVGIWKADGSLSSGGAEYVSRPYTVESFREVNFHGFLKTLHGAGARGDKTYECGMHIHVGRKPLQHAAMKAMIKSGFGEQECQDRYYLNTLTNILSTFVLQGNAHLFSKISRREGKMSYCEVLASHSPYSHDWWRNERRRALNITNDNTLEFRIWRGTTDYKHAKFAIGMSLAFHDYVEYLLNQGFYSGFASGSLTLLDFIEKEPRYKQVQEYLCKMFTYEELHEFKRLYKSFVGYQVGNLREALASNRLHKFYLAKRVQSVPLTDSELLASLEAREDAGF